MGKHTPSLDSHRKKEEYIREHLFNELHWLLHAATEWSVQEQMQLRISGYNVQNYAMDSACLHARSLFEFFTGKTSNNHYACDGFLSESLTSGYYEKGNASSWSGPLHSHLMHAQDRSKPQQLKTLDGFKDLNQMPVYFAREILTLWEEFENKLGASGLAENEKLQKLAREKREEAIRNAHCVVDSEVAKKHAEGKQIQLKAVFS
jgi:hypothetical protein